MGKKKDREKDRGVFNKQGKIKHTHLAIELPDLSEESIQRFDKEVFEKEIRPLLKDKGTIEILKNVPDKDECVRKLMFVPASKVPDEDFFELIQKEPRLLGSRFAQEKINRWQSDIMSTDANIVFKAQDNLKRIGSSLALKGCDRPRIPETLVALQAERNYVIITKKNIAGARNEAHVKLTLKELFGNKIISSMKTIPKSNRILADTVTGLMLGLSPKTVKTYRKRTKPLCEQGTAGGFVLKEKR